MSEVSRSLRAEPRFDVEPEAPAVERGSRDPLAELARIVGQDDPFKSVFRTSAPAAERPQPQRSEPRVHAEVPAYVPRPIPAPQLPEPFRDDAEPLYDFEDAHLRGTLDDHDRAAESDDASQHSQAFDDYYESAHAEVAGQGFAPPPFVPEPVAHAEQPTAEWQAPPVEAVPDGEPAGDAAPAAEGPRAARRPLVVLACMLVLTGGGLALSLMARGPSAGVASKGGAPTIMAQAGPSKIKPEDTTDSTPVSQEGDSVLLNRNAAASSTPAKIVTSQEQPVDLATLPKSQPTPDAAQTASPFPEPRKVKTVLVRADGSVIGSTPSAAAAATTAPAPSQSVQATIASLTGVPVPDGSPSAAQPPVLPAAPAPKASTPPVAAHGTSTPRAASTPDGDAAQPAHARQPASAGVKPQVKPKPEESATAGGDPAPGAGFAIQLAAPPTEQDARDIFSRLHAKYPDQLGSAKPVIRRADVGDKSVYRLRVSNLTQDEAKTICAQLQASGDTCYVVRK